MRCRQKRSGQEATDELIEAVMEDPRPQDRTKEALINRLEMAKTWGIFSNSYENVWEKLDNSSINVLDQ